MRWIEMYKKMKADGWSHIRIPGEESTPWYFVHPSCKGRSITTILREGKEGEHYLTSVEDIKAYARINLGWVPPQNISQGLDAAARSEEESSRGLVTGSDNPPKLTQSSFTIMASSDAWTLLVKHFGFTYHCGNYYFPSNKKNQTGKVSPTVCFGTIKELRQHLCAYGLPEVKKLLNKDEVENLHRWIRYTYVVGLVDKQKINPQDEMVWAETWEMLQQLGFKYSNGTYVYPNIDEPSLIFKRQQDYIDHIARFGIPSDDVLNKEDRLKLDLYFAKIEIDSFTRINPHTNKKAIKKLESKRRKLKEKLEIEMKVLDEEIEQLRYSDPQQQKAGSNADDFHGPSQQVTMKKQRQVQDTDAVLLLDWRTGQTIINCTQLVGDQLNNNMIEDNMHSGLLQDKKDGKLQLIDVRKADGRFGNDGRGLVWDYMPEGRDVKVFAETFVQLASVVAEALANGNKVLLYCKNGRSRSPAVVATFYILFRGVSLGGVKMWFKEAYPKQRPLTASVSASFPNLERFESILNLFTECLKDPTTTVRGFNLAECVASCSKALGHPLEIERLPSTNQHSTAIPPWMRRSASQTSRQPTMTRGKRRLEVLETTHP